MSKIIRITKEDLVECQKDFAESLKGLKLVNGKFSFSKVFSAKANEATLYYTAEAWTKIVVLLEHFTKEVAWHGVAQRVEGDESAYIISDILVYPQTVTGSTVEMDTGEYAKWLQHGDERGDERFDYLKMQGHSHVNMGVTPSGVDLHHQEEILRQLGDKSFYIFMIYNKSFKHDIKIYDMALNTMFDDSDITVKIIDAVEGVDDFLESAKDLVKDRVVVTAKTTHHGDKTKTNIGMGYGAYGGMYNRYGYEMW